jgi:hypothetical protein
MLMYRVKGLEKNNMYRVKGLEKKMKEFTEKATLLKELES